MGKIEEALREMIDCYLRGGKILLAGNGGSAADCDHIVGELMKGFLKKRPITKEKAELMKENNPATSDELISSLQCGLPAISLPALCALNSAFSNDCNAEFIYAQAVMALGRSEDLLIAISTSGNSKNVCRAADTAKALGIKVIALTGDGGGKLAEIADVTVAVPEKETYKVQELHLPVYHYLCAGVEAHFFKE